LRSSARRCSKCLAALGRIVLSKRERVKALDPYGRGLIGTTLHCASEVREQRLRMGTRAAAAPDEGEGSAKNGLTRRVG
jgi:non-homologous end joining protein Ku